MEEMVYRIIKWSDGKNYLVLTQAKAKYFQRPCFIDDDGNKFLVVRA